MEVLQREKSLPIYSYSVKLKIFNFENITGLRYVNPTYYELTEIKILFLNWAGFNRLR